MKAELLQYFYNHLTIILMSIAHFFSMIIYSIIEYKIGENPKLKNSVWAIIVSKLWSKS